MAGFFEKFGEKVATVVGDAGNAVGDFAQESKLKLNIKKQEDIIKDLKQQYGKDVVEDRMRGEGEALILAKLDEACQKIRAAEGEIALINAEIKKIKESKQSSSNNGNKGDREL